MINLRKTIPLLVAILATSAGVFAADTGAAAKPATPSLAAGNPDLQKLISQFSARRDSILADREALVNQLKSATAEQRKVILEKMQAQQKDLLDAQRALGRQIRDEMRKIRQLSPATPGRR